MVQPLPWVLGVALGASTAHAAAPAAKAAGSKPPVAAPAVELATEPAEAASEPSTASRPGTPSKTSTASEPGTPSETSTASTPSTPSEPSTASEPGTPSEPATGLQPALASQTPAAASSAPASADAPAPSPASAPADPDARPPRTYPRLVLAGGPIVGPHALGNEECNSELGRCETKGSFLGLGAQVELRARLWKLVYAHARGLTVGNVSPNDRIHRGLWGVGAGVGLQGRRAFGRAEYLFLDTFGDNHFEPPFYQGEVASDEWGHHAGMLSVGFRQPLPHRLSAELWGGLVIGPRSVRRVPDMAPDDRVLTTFLVGLNVSWDAWP